MDARDVLDALADGDVVSGEALADEFGVSRNAVWKHVETLRDEGFGVESTPDGYRLDEVPEYGGLAVSYRLGGRTRYVGHGIEYHDTVESTNSVAVERAREDVNEGYVVLANEQTGGRGRRRRDWSSPSGGIWTSVVLRPELAPRDASLVTLAASVAVARAVEKTGVDATIKWPNDILVDERKLCGILVEMEADAERVAHAVVGIGLNANSVPDVPDASPTSLAEHVGEVDRASVTADVLAELEKAYETGADIVDDWRERTSTLGRRVRVETPNETVEGTAEGVDGTGALRISTDGGERVVTAGDCVHLR
ncbi:biotin--[acetyl-CoA-carboxylase] ligase [Haladaptatus sp. F3-133]|jgi:BirA family biotin operon repressor/biotin-[acetyl-CoA-carboxylase] ligase|uniref:Biotin--[acetyl-CoA-carboxylase] ligase n=1 Tax=Halorutilus salinus TaxID=2487751 RepID=A0A9Q4C3I6_9EURY|nr:biotin--[acetyl-CoA-carboxylase] ligase [Halorutilus salinus]MCX2819210.1 biotin--[acetyl-CoA-carboxylase] ligase [Halorutilus salinus]